VAQHGAKESTGRAFIGEVTPKIAVISVSKYNLDGLPDWQVLERLKPAEILRTDGDGNIMIKTDGSEYFVEK